MIRIRQIKIPVLEDSSEILLSKISSLLKVNEADIVSYFIRKKSIDARDKNDIYYVYEVDIDILSEKQILKKNIILKSLVLKN